MDDDEKVAATITPNAAQLSWLPRLPQLVQRTDFFRGCIWRISTGFRQFPGPNGV
jgi:hypothetical protein